MADKRELKGLQRGRPSLLARSPGEEDESTPSGTSTFCLPLRLGMRAVQTTAPAACCSTTATTQVHAHTAAAAAALDYLEANRVPASHPAPLSFLSVPSSEAAVEGEAGSGECRRRSSLFRRRDLTCLSQRELAPWSRGLKGLAKCV